MKYFDQKEMEIFDKTFYQDKSGEKVDKYLLAVPALLYPKEGMSAMYVKIAIPEDIKAFILDSYARRDAMMREELLRKVQGILTWKNQQKFAHENDITSIINETYGRNKAGDKPDTRAIHIRRADIPECVATEGPGIQDKRDCKGR